MTEKGYNDLIKLYGLDSNVESVASEVAVTAMLGVVPVGGAVSHPASYWKTKTF